MNKLVKSGETIFFEGEPGDCAYIIEKGSVDLSIFVNGTPKKISRLARGTLLGEMALIGDCLRSATAIACEDTELLIIPESYFTERMENSDPFITLLLKTILQRYFEMRGRLDHVLREFKHIEILMVGEQTIPETTHDTFNTIRQIVAENNLKEALESRQLELFYQPIVALNSLQVMGCEALIRWRHPERGLVSPNDFIGVAEDSGLIVPIGTWIIEEASQACLRFKRASGHFGFVSVNLSGKQFIPGDLLDNIQAIFAKYKIPAKAIKFEITESMLMANPIDAAQVLMDLKAMGSTIAIDDFGTGYSSFSYLHRFPIDTLKIDKSFIETMISNKKSYEIVKSLCILAQSIGMCIVAEGVECEDEQNLLTELAVDYGQGYFYAKPMPEAEFHDYLQHDHE